MLRAPQPSASDTVRRSLPWRRGFQPRPNPRRWSFQLRHAGAARCRTSLCLRTAQRQPLSPLLQPLQGAVVVVRIGRDDSASPRSGETSRLAVSDAERIRPPAVYRPFPLLNSQTPRLPAAKAIPVPMSSSAKSPVKRPFRGVCPSPRSTGVAPLPRYYGLIRLLLSLSLVAVLPSSFAELSGSAAPFAPPRPPCPNRVSKAMLASRPQRR